MPSPQNNNNNPLLSHLPSIQRVLLFSCNIFPSSSSDDESTSSSNLSRVASLARVSSSWDEAMFDKNVNTWSLILKLHLEHEENKAAAKVNYPRANEELIFYLSQALSRSVANSDAFDQTVSFRIGFQGLSEETKSLISKSTKSTMMPMAEFSPDVVAMKSPTASNRVLFFEKEATDDEAFPSSVPAFIVKVGELRQAANFLKHRYEATVFDTIQEMAPSPDGMYVALVHSYGVVSLNSFVNGSLIEILNYKSGVDGASNNNRRECKVVYDYRLEQLETELMMKKSSSPSSSCKMMAEALKKEREESIAEFSGQKTTDDPDPTSRRFGMKVVFSADSSRLFLLENKMIFSFNIKTRKYESCLALPLDELMTCEDNNNENDADEDEDEKEEEEEQESDDENDSSDGDLEQLCMSKIISPDGKKICIYFHTSAGTNRIMMIDVVPVATVGNDDDLDHYEFRFAGVLRPNDGANKKSKKVAAVSTSLAFSMDSQSLFYLEKTGMLRSFNTSSNEENRPPLDLGSKLIDEGAVDSASELCFSKVSASPDGKQLTVSEVFAEARFQIELRTDDDKKSWKVELEHLVGDFDEGAAHMVEYAPLRTKLKNQLILCTMASGNSYCIQDSLGAGVKEVEEDLEGEYLTASVWNGVCGATTTKIGDNNNNNFGVRAGRFIAVGSQFNGYASICASFIYQKPLGSMKIAAADTAAIVKDAVRIFFDENKNLFCENIFGEQKQMLSNPVSLTKLDPELE